MNYPHRATVQRQAKTGTKYIYAGVDGTVPCFLQPLDAEQSALFGLTYGKSYYCYIPLAAEVMEKDRLVIDSATYGVRGMKVHNYGSLAHKRLTLERT